MKLKSILLAACAFCCTLAAQAAVVDTVMVKSRAMNKEIKVVFVVPDAAAQGSMNCPAVYLLHGFGGDARAWLRLKPELVQEADRLGMIFVCPDGQKSWYWDSPLNKDVRFETFVSKELITYTDRNYPTVARKQARAVTGLSMGGHGALWLSFRHKDVFGAAGSMSGGVDIRPFPNNWEMKAQLGEEKDNQARWDAYTVINQVDKIANGDLALTIDCGVDDFFYDVNVALHNKLLEKKIDHDFTTRPGAHTGEYWNNSIDYHLLFFKKYFAGEKK